ncbi:hypothetical protein DAKH74_051510 [Maudiozyma humilis]|uniref:Uncharacterized protein n=1 Tax=Maudiozyma humilis TaxID=51915 RepID=A0AAV5S805_MAUHU|nr:hypothetical protein DAKH74_051510 [Kazachstania humilis]
MFTGNKQLAELHALILKATNPPPSHLVYGQPYLAKEKVEEFLDSLPKIKADGSNYTLWKRQFEEGKARYECFNVFDRDLDPEKDEPIQLAIAAALEFMLSMKIKKFLEDSDFASSIHYLSCKERLERIDDRYVVLEWEQIKKDLLDGFAADRKTPLTNSTKQLFAERGEFIRSLADNPRIALPVLLFSPLQHYRDEDGEFPISIKKFTYEVTDKIMNMPPEDVNCIGDQLARWAGILSDFARNNENFASDEKVFYTPEDDNEDLPVHAETVPSGMSDPAFVRYAKFFYSKETKSPIKNIGIPKAILFKYFFNVKLCPLCLEQECDFATHKCSR